MSPQNLAYQAYSQAFSTVSKTKQIVMLYDGAIRFIKQSKVAIADDKIEERYNLLIKASDIITGLQGCLDFENGGEVATSLYDFYSSLDAKITSIHRTNSVEECDAVIAELKDMRIIWENIDHSKTINDQILQEDVNSRLETNQYSAVNNPPPENLDDLSNNITA